MEHYITLFDSTFLPQGLALHQSMQRHVGTYTLWILCMDTEAYKVLKTLDLPNVRLLLAESLETSELKSVKPDRSRGEYCWTMTPFAPRFVFESDPSVERVTYLDADLWFCKSPQPIFDEFNASGKCVLITEHGYAPECDASATSGHYCVQFMTFKRNGGETVRKWWEDRCIEWCYARYEGDKFGDQKYLDDWTFRFRDQVHVLSRQELAQAPWNATYYPYSKAVFFHFHSLRILPRQCISLVGGYPLPPVVIKYIYNPYINDLKRSILSLQDIGFEVRAQTKPLNPLKWVRSVAGGVYRQLWRFRSRYYYYY